MRTVAAIAILALVGIAAVSASDATGLQYAGLDTTLGVNANMLQLNGVKELSSPRCSRVVVGSDVNGRDITIGTNDDAVEMLSVGWDGAIGGDDLRDIAAMEAEFGLTGMVKTVRAECDEAVTDNGLACVQIAHACESPDAVWCPVKFLSFWPPEGEKSAGNTRLVWERAPQGTAL